MINISFTETLIFDLIRDHYRHPSNFVLYLVERI